MKRLVVLPAFAAAAVLLVATHAATAQSASGTITGRVLWGNCIRAIPLPAQPAEPAAPDAQAQPQPPRPIVPSTGLPAGAVLVAVQNTSISARTDEAGQFSLSGVPAGQYLTVAAGPVANATNAIAERPNVFVNGGQSVDVGTLSLGGTGGLSIACRAIPGPQSSTGTDANGGDTGMPAAPDQPPTSP